MDRRQFAIAIATRGGQLLLEPLSSLRAAAQDRDGFSLAYAESIEIGGLTDDGVSEFEVRVARFRSARASS